MTCQHNDPMKIIRFIISFSITATVVVAMNIKIGPMPPLGKFMDPFHGFWATSTAAMDIPEQIYMEGLHQPVRILYDDMLVPHIFAENDDDLYQAVGYAHAFHRLWQMEFQTHAAAGRLSEVVGNITLDMDRGQRRKGLVFGAENFVNNLDEDAERILNNYTKGVNAYINQLDYADYPFEYKLLDYAPEPWTPLKTGLLYKYMSDMLNSGERDIENTNFRSIYGKELLDLIYPDVDSYIDPVVDLPGGWGFTPITKRLDESKDTEKDVISMKLLDQPHRNNGSNNWAVGPERSATGNAFLANDMHLSLYLPSLWFYNQMHTKSMNVFGHSLPGIPFVITGFTDSIAWGFTNAQRDLVDWYKIKFEDEGRSRYLLDGEYVATQKKVEKFHIRGADTFYDTVVYSVFGPVTYDNSFHGKSGKNGYARRWIDHDASTGFNMFYQINRAKNFDDYMAALDQFTSPAQNIVFASVQGDIAHRVQGKYPLNNKEEGKFVKDGTKSSNNWTEYIPNEQNPFWKNPTRGFVSSANQQPADSTYPYYITSRQFESYRNRRINDLLRADSSITLADLKKLHFDNYGLKASESLPFMIQQLNGANLSAQEQDIIQQLKSWDFYYNMDTKAAVYYDIWYNNLYEGIWDEIDSAQNQNIALFYPTDFSTIKLMQQFPSLPFFDNAATPPEKETVKDLALSSFRGMIQKVSEIHDKGIDSWSEYSATEVNHQLRIPSLGYSYIATGGSGDGVVNATGTNHGPSQRIIVELDPKGVKAWGHYPGGQSGNPGSKFYNDMVEAWADGTYFDLLYLDHIDSSNERVIFSQTLSPN